MAGNCCTARDPLRTTVISCCPGSTSPPRAPSSSAPARRSKPRTRPAPGPGQSAAGEDLVEPLVGDPARDPLGHPRAIPARPLLGERLHRIVMGMRATRPAPGQRERVHDRSRPGLEVEGVEAAQHRLAVRQRRGRVLAARRPFARHRIRTGAGPARPAAGQRACGRPACRRPATGRNRGPRTGWPAPTAPRPPRGTGTSAAAPSHTNAASRAATRRLQLLQERGHRRTAAERIDQPIGLPDHVGLDHRADTHNDQRDQIPRGILRSEHKHGR